MLSESETSRAMIDRIPAGGREGCAFRQRIKLFFYTLHNVV